MFKQIYIWITLLVGISYANSSEFTTSLNDFTATLLNKLNSISDDYTVFSPLSIVTAYGMILKGSKGITAEEIYSKMFWAHRLDDIHPFITQILKDLKNENRNFTLNIANKLIANEQFPIHQNYADFLKNKYLSPIERGVFNEAMETKVNKWVRDATNGKIDQILDSLDPQSQLILLNALHFKSEWLTKFSHEITTIFNFTNYDLSISKVKYMIHREMEIKYINFTNKGFEVGGLRLYGNVTLYIILPHQIAQFDNVLSQLENFLESPEGKFLERIPLRTRLVMLPKMKLTKQLNLKKILKNIGINTVFTNDADLSRISDQQIRLSRSIHKSILDINESGIEGTSVTYAGFIDKYGVQSLPRFDVRRPFIYLLKDDIKKNILFAGFVKRLYK